MTNPPPPNPPTPRIKIGSVLRAADGRRLRVTRIRRLPLKDNERPADEPTMRPVFDPEGAP
jgi:hypothetical protein